MFSFITDKLTSKMTISKAKNILANITYKHYWKMDIYKDYSNTVRLEIESYQPDVRYGDRAAPIVGSKIKPLDHFQNMTEADILKWVEEIIKMKEEHEFQEWFKYKGKNIHEPHPKTGDL